MHRYGLGPAAPQPDDFEPAPIRPEWVIEGRPQARAVELVRGVQYLRTALGLRRPPALQRHPDAATVPF